MTGAATIMLSYTCATLSYVLAVCVYTQWPGQLTFLLGQLKTNNYYFRPLYVFQHCVTPLTFLYLEPSFVGGITPLS